jgi:DNA polymerase-3 subunit beta
MKIELNRSDVELAFKKVSSVNQNNSLPVLNESLIDFKDGRMTVYASDTEISILTSMEIVNSEGDLRPIVVNTNMILRTINTLKSETIFLEVKDKDVCITVPKSKKEYSVPIIYGPDSFIKKLIGNTVSSITLPGAKFCEIMKSASIFVNAADLRNSLRGISVYHDDGEHLKFFGGSSNCFNFLSIKSEGNIGKIIIPKTISKVLELFNHSASIEICIDETNTNIVIINGHDTYSIRLIDAKLVDAEGLLSKLIRDNRVIVDREQMLQAVTRLMIYSPSNGDADIDIDLSGDEIVLTAQDLAFRKKGVETIPFLVKDGDLDFMFTVNSKYLSQSLRSFSSEQITIIKSQGPTPMLIHDDGHRGFSSEYLVAPINKNHNAN